MDGAAAVVAGRFVDSEVVFTVVRLYGLRAATAVEVEKDWEEALCFDNERTALVPWRNGILVAMVNRRLLKKLTTCVKGEREASNN